MNKKHFILALTAWLILLLPNITTAILCTDINYSITKELGYWAVSIVCVLLPATFLKMRTCFIFEGIIGLFWAPIEIASLYLNRLTTSSHFMGNIFETNHTEAFELLGAVWPLIIVVVSIWILYWVLVFQMDNIYFMPSIARKLIWWSLPLLAIFGCAFMLVAFHSQTEHTNKGEQLIDASNKIVIKFRKIYPLNIYLATHDWLQQKAMIRSLDEQLQDFSFHLTPKTDSIEEHYILIIGEAARYDHFHINGYPRNTSPSLDTISRLTSLSQCYSVANLTRNAIEMMLTRATIQHPEISLREKSIVEAFQECGFYTAWITCQPLWAYTARIAHTTDYYYESIAGFQGQQGILDTMVIGQAQRCLYSSHAKKTFYVLHTLGSHFKYNQRHPQEYERFTPAIQNSDQYTILSPNNKSQIINSYDNSICYTDHIIASTIDLLRKQNGRCALIYISDHGENLLDDSRQLFGHGFYEGNLYESHIPCFIWMNDAYQQAYADKAAALQTHHDTPVSQDVLFYSLADLAGIDAIVDPTKSIFSPYLLPQDTIYMLTGNETIVSLLPQ